MKKTTKLLSVLLAVVMLMSCFTMASYAAITDVSSGEALDNLGAYSPDGAATRFSTEERMSIFMDFLDKVLYNVNWAGIDNTDTVELHVHINSVDQICESLDSIKSALSSGLVGFGSFIGILGYLGDADFSSWVANTRRSNTAQLEIIRLILLVLTKNKTLIDKILKNGKIDLGSIINGKVDLSKINIMVSDLPKLLRTKIFPLLGRRDDPKTTTQAYAKGEGTISSHLNTLVTSLFTRAQSNTTYKENAAGQCTSGHNLPQKSENLRYYFEKTTTETPNYFTCYVFNGETGAYAPEDAKYYRVEETAGSGVYVYKQKTGNTYEGESLKWFKDGTYWLQTLATALKNETQTININSESAATLLYKFIPYVFGDLAPIALNGWAKYALATWMGATGTKKFEGKLSEGTASTYYASLPASVKSFFSASVPYYQFSYSNYLAYSDNLQYYRYVDKDTNTEEWFEVDMTTGNYYLSLFNFGYTVGADFMNEFNPGSATATKTLLQSLNDFLIKAARTVLKTSAFNELNLTTGGNENLIPNIKKVIQTLLPRSPEAILGPDYQIHYAGYYEMLTTSTDNQEIVSGLAAIIAKALMPQLILPDSTKLSGQKLGAVLACVVRELATQFLPTYNYDALIFSNYNTRTLVSGKDNDYWLDVILTMGVDIGMSYLKELTDLGEDVSGGYTFAASKTYTTSGFNQKGWENTVDWIIDWALTSSVEWGWNIEKIVDTENLTISLTTNEDPWEKLDHILVYDSSSNAKGLLPLKEIINCTAASGQTWLETVLRDKFVMGIANLNFEYIVGKGTNYTATGNAGLLSIPSGSVLRTTGLVPVLFTQVRDLLNRVINKILSGSIIPSSTVPNIDTLFNTSSGSNGKNTVIQAIVDNLLPKLGNLNTNGLWVALLPLLEMFVGWKTSSQEFADPEVKWGGSYIHGTDSIELSLTNSSSGMLLKHGDDDYENPYNLVVDEITSDATSPTLSMTRTTSNVAAPYGRVKYTVKANAAPSTEQTVRVTIKYHFSKKSGSDRLGNYPDLNVSGYRYVSTYIVLSNNSSDIAVDNNKNDFNDGCDYKTNLENTQYALCTSRDSIEAVLGSSVYFMVMNVHTSDCYFNKNTPTFTSNSSDNFATSSEITAAKAAKIAANSAITIHPAVKVEDSDEDFVSGGIYPIGKFSYKIAKSANQTSGKGPANQTLGNFYFADMGELSDLYYKELGMNRIADDYETAGNFSNYVTAMKNAALLVTKPMMQSTFASTYTKTNIDAKFNALQDAIELLEDNTKPAAGNTDILDAGLAAGEVASLRGADGQINFQDYELYGYWAYEKNRTEARNILKEYQRPTAPEQYIEGCWLPYTDNEKHEDLSTAINGVTNAKKKAAIINSLKAPEAKAVAAYQEANGNWQMPSYSTLYVADIADKLDYYNDYLIPRAYSTESAGRAQLNQEISYATAKNYVQANYTERSWARYADALSRANAIKNGNRGTGAKQSEVFLAKYNLLVAQRQLRLKTQDYATQYGFDNLNALIAIAEGMFDNYQYFASADPNVTDIDAWTNLIEALGYDVEFPGTDNNPWTMDLYEKSAKQLISEELYSGSTRNAERVEDVTEALQAAIDGLKCTLTVVKNDQTTVVDSDIMYITNIAPLSLNSANDVLAHVKLSDTSAPAALAVNGTTNGFGSGTSVTATLNGMTAPFATYYIVVYGDINGDDAIDGFDAVKADRRLATGTLLDDPLEKAADATKEGTFDIADVAAIISEASGVGTGISQS